MYIKCMLTLEELISFFKKEQLLSKYHLDNVGIFGSIVRCNTPNDIDLLITDFEDNHDLIGLKKELEEKTGKDVDIVIQKYASPIIVHRALKEVRYVA